MENLKKQNWGMIISLSLWCAITLIRVLLRSPWFDEAHAWLIAQELDLFEIIKLMKIEGHTFLWYLVQMPFAKTNFMYPYSMLLLNWLFCFIAILILWLKAPFNNWVKFFISFSFPFLGMYSVVARCYAIGIMFLFALTAMEKSKLKHPNWYSLLLILCANTSIMAAAGATVFGIMFVFNMKFTVFILFASLPILILLVLTVGAGLIMATINVFFRDMEHLYAVFCTMLMYAMPIFYPADIVPPRFRIFQTYNPLLQIIEALRDCFLYGKLYEPFMIYYSAICAVILLAIGLLLFYKYQDKFILYV